MKSLLLGGVALPLALLTAGTAEASVRLTDSSVFSANGSGHNWLSWFWNTQGSGTDAPNRWNMYYSSSLDPDNPTFINSGNEGTAQISLDLGAGVHDFVVFGERAGDPTPHSADLHFVANLYFDGNQSAPDISGLYGPSCPAVCAASSGMGLDLYGNAPSQEAGTLQYVSGGTAVTLSKFSWAVDDQVDEVWPHFAGAYNGTYSGTPDYVGRLQLTVTEAPAVPLPAAGALLGSGALLLGGFRKVRRR